MGRTSSTVWMDVTSHEREQLGLSSAKAIGIQAREEQPRTAARPRTLEHVRETLTPPLRESKRVKCLRAYLLSESLPSCSPSLFL